VGSAKTGWLLKATTRVHKNEKKETRTRIRPYEEPGKTSLDNRGGKEYASDEEKQTHKLGWGGFDCVKGEKLLKGQKKKCRQFRAKQKEIRW